MTLTIRTRYRNGRITASTTIDGKRRRLSRRYRGPSLMDAQRDAARALAQREGWNAEGVLRRPALMESPVSIATAWEVSK